MWITCGYFEARHMLCTYNLHFRPSISVWCNGLRALDTAGVIQDHEERRQVDLAVKPSAASHARFAAEEGALRRGGSAGGKI